MNWRTLWQARFGEKLDPSEASVWEEELQHEITHLGQDEIIEAVRDIGEQKRRGEMKYKPTLNHLISAIKRMRYQAQNHVASDQVVTHKEERIRTSFNAVSRCLQRGDVVGAWVIICHHEPFDDCPELEQQCINRLNFTRPTIEEMGCKPYLQVVSEQDDDGCGVVRFNPHDEYEVREHNKSMRRELAAL